MKCDKDEWLFLAAASSFASSTQGIVSLLLPRSFVALWGLKIGRLQQERATVRGWEREKRRKTEGRSSSDGLSINKEEKKSTFPNNNLCWYIMYIYPGMPVCHCEPSSRDYMSRLPAQREDRAGGWAGWECGAAATQQIQMKYRNAANLSFLLK